MIDQRLSRRQEVRHQIGGEPISTNLDSGAEDAGKTSVRFRPWQFNNKERRVKIEKSH